MAVTKKSAALQALTVAALAMLSPAHAEDDNETTFSYGYYDEGKRELFGTKHNGTRPIHVDTLNGSTRLRLSDRVKLALNYVQDTWSGATPLTTAPIGFMDTLPATLTTGASSYINSSTNYVDRNFNPYKIDYNVYNPNNGTFKAVKQSTQLAHIISTASPETRKQGDVNLSYEWDEAAVGGGGGVSIENDYESYFLSGNGRWDFNQKLTTLNAGLSYTHSDIHAKLDPYGQGYVQANHYLDFSLPPADRRVGGQKEDWATTLSLTQVINKSAVVAGSFGYTHTTGFMENPYKAATFIFMDTTQTDPALPNLFVANIMNPLEVRPDERNQWTWSTRYVQHIAPVDAALHADYRYYLDDWGIAAHTFDLAWQQPISDGWTITPRIRYYSQSAADFYQPVFYFKQTVPRNNGQQLDLSRVPISSFSSDHRLSGYGALSGGITISKQFAKGIALELGAEYYTHAGSLKLGGGGEGNYADFDSTFFNAALKVNLAALSSHSGSDHSAHQQHQDHHQHHHAPAGVMFDHTLSKAGEAMLGYRYMYNSQANSTLHGEQTATDASIMAQGCGNKLCSVTPLEMHMHMHMLDLMVAPTDWLTLMLMPQFMDMNMQLRPLAGIAGGNASHATGGVGDTGMYALFNVWQGEQQKLHASLGLSAPTGDAGIKLSPIQHHQGSGTGGGFIHYGMQLGSGTWDFKPSLTYTGQWQDWSYGAQLSGTVRLENSNGSGFAFGDILQTTAWGSYAFNNWLSASVRGVYTVQGKIQRSFNPAIEVSGSMDTPSSYGGRYWDVGFGLNAFVPSGELKGNALSFEWLQPVSDDVNGYQLDRDGALSATWSVAF